MKLIKLNPLSFEKVIYDNCENCLVAFTREDCHVCMEVVPLLEEIAEKYAGNFGFYSVDVEKEKDLYNRFPLRGVPSIMFFKDGSFKGKLAGKVEEDQIQEKIAEML
ncbi:MAG: thioredoxin family protein [Deltaproteobacteria bacterium]|nr:thioredoxin family protein [Deltaproteobacteria bacterium]